MQARRFCVAGTALCDVAFRDVVAGAVFSDVAKVLLPRIAMAGMRKHDTTTNIVVYAQDLLFAQIAMAGTRKRNITSDIVAGAAFRECLEKWRKLRTSHIF